MYKFQNIKFKNFMFNVLQKLNDYFLGILESSTSKMIYIYIYIYIIINKKL